MSQLFFSFTKYGYFLPSERTFFYHIIRSSRLPAPDISSAKHTLWTSGDVICNIFTSGIVPKAYKAMAKLSPYVIPSKE